MTHTLKRIEWIKSLCRRTLGVMAIGGMLFSALILATPLTGQIGQIGPDRQRQRQETNPFPPPLPPTNSTQGRTEKQKEALVKSNFRQMKKHANELAELAQSLQRKIDQTNENVLSLEIIQKAEEIEKLAKKIKSEAKGY
jgi:hypothetical protein